MSILEENSSICGIWSLQRAPEHGQCGGHFKGSVCNRELSHFQLSTRTGCASAGWNTEKVSHPDLQSTPWCYGRGFLLLALSQLLLWDVGRQTWKSAVFLSLSFVRFYLTHETCCTMLLRFAFDTCSVNTKQWCYFSNIKGHYHGADSIWWCYILHSLSLSCYLISEILCIVYPNQRFSKNIKGKWYDSLSASTLIWKNVSLEGSSLNESL